MPKEEWGVKRVCPTTGKRFYDLGRTPIISPYTGETITLDTGGKTRALLKETKEDNAVKAGDLIDDDEVLEDDDADVDLGDDVLEDDDDDNVSLEEIADVPSEDDDS